MPGPSSCSSEGPGDRSPYLPAYCYQNEPKMCPCGHHEGFHNSDGKCLLDAECGCPCLPPDCETPIEEMYEASKGLTRLEVALGSLEKKLGEQIERREEALNVKDPRL